MLSSLRTSSPIRFRDHRHRWRHFVCLAAIAIVALLPTIARPAGPEPPPVLPPSGDRAIHGEEQQKETVTIDGARYQVPPPWAGNRIIKPLPAAFQQIPVEFTVDQTDLYVAESTWEPLCALLKQAQHDGVALLVESGYRSERYQRLIFKRMLAAGKPFADIIRFVAPPGYSEHMLGTAVDFYPSNWQFAETPAYQWLKNNAGTFGFVESYPKHGPSNLPWEAWHWNYLGR